MELVLRNIQGSEISKINFLNSFNPEDTINLELIHEAIVNYLANQRQGTSSTKTRAEVSGGGKKPWRQKGTGRARVGSNRSPLWRHGGIIFGPKPRDYSYSMPAQKRRKALVSALLLKAQNLELIAVDNLFENNTGKTKEVVQILKNFELYQNKSLFVIKNKAEKFIRATKNIENLSLVYANDINIYDIMNANYLICDKESIDFLNEKFEAGK